MCRRSDRAKLRKLIGVGQLAVDQQVAGLDEIAPLGEHFDRIAAVAQHAYVAVEKGDRAGCRSGVGISLVERDIAGLRTQFRDVNGVLVFGPHDNRQINLLVADAQFGHLAHRGIPFYQRYLLWMFLARERPPTAGKKLSLSTPRAAHNRRDGGRQTSGCGERDVNDNLAKCSARCSAIFAG